MFISIIIPTYQSEQIIGKTLAEIEQYVSSSEHRFEVVVVDVGYPAVEKRITVAGIPWGIVSYPPAIGSLDQVR